MLLTAAAAYAGSPPKLAATYCTAETHTSIGIGGSIESESGVRWSFSYSQTQGGPWTSVPGAEGTKPEDSQHESGVTAELTDLTPEVPYYFLLTAENTSGETTTREIEPHGENGGGLVVSCETVPFRPIPEVERFDHVLADSAQALSEIDPHDSETHWRFEDAPKEAGPWTPVPGAEGTISRAEAEALPTSDSAHFTAELTGLQGGTIYYVRLFAENEPESGVHKHATSRVSSFETSGPPAATTFATHALHGEALRLLGYVEPNVEEGSYDTHYHFEYVDQRHFETEGGFAGPDTRSTPEIDFESIRGGYVGADLPMLQPGESYRYRLAATNTTPGDPVVHGAEQTLTVPLAPRPASEASCPNEAFRTGPSADLPDCRAYEQVTPVDKEGAEEPFHYGEGEVENPGALIGEDGDHFEFDGRFVHWGSAGGSPYFFARTEKGWQMTPGTAQPEAGIDIHYAPELDSPDLTQFAFDAGWQTSAGVESSDLEFKLGAPGGPYVTAASVSRKQVGLEDEGGWVAASEDFSDLIFATEDHTFVPGHSTGTASGLDLYEYSSGVFRQTNVDSTGKTIGTCGASVAAGSGEGEHTEGNGITTTSTRHSVSADGSRVFFYAVPTGSACSEPRHLYLRIGGTETVDLGSDTLVAANSDGTEVLLEARVGGTQEVFLYEIASHASKHLFSQVYEGALAGTFLPVSVSEDFSTIYLPSRQQLTPEAPPVSSGSKDLDFYRYDIAAEKLSFAFQGSSVNSVGAPPMRISADGRYASIEGEVAAVPGGAAGTNNVGQVYRYDSVEGVVECLSCASPFDPEPRYSAFFTNEEQGANSLTKNGVPGETVGSANGDYVFFDTVSALVPQDVNGEIEPENKAHREYTSPALSPSSDVYEWRKPGVNGCGLVRGCVSLISSGGDGKLVMLLGSAADGRDVFFTTAAQLGSRDDDSALDVYDARIDGGFALPPPRPTECEGAACSTPFATPSDLTPSSSTFQGAGDVFDLTPANVKAKPQPKKIKAKKKPKKKRAQPKRNARKPKKNSHRRSR